MEQSKLAEYGIRSNPNSGATWHTKGDGRTEEYFVEFKGTEKDTFKVTSTLMKKTAEQAAKMGRDPILFVHFAKFGRDVFVVPEWIDTEEDFEHMEDTTLSPWDNALLMQLGGKNYKVLTGAIAKSRLRLADS